MQCHDQQQKPEGEPSNLAFVELGPQIVHVLLYMKDLSVDWTAFFGNFGGTCC